MTITADTLERVVLVDERDAEIGTGPKLETHQAGALHRAFSIFLFDQEGRTLVQRRALTKYHSGGKWANTCCGHPRPGEAIEAAAHRRLREELGMTANLTHGFLTRYRAELDGEMIENELVHVYFGAVTSSPVLNPDEASDTRLIDLLSLKQGAGLAVSEQTAWLRHYLDHHFDELVALSQVTL
ncbi:MAG: isopentenyl-diphosphate Delta-isomerase [Henriciella sp.]|nr:isopentenyl-diphosphate Delta-isomerase [Hyphomonadaceae bacterium]